MPLQGLTTVFYKKCTAIMLELLQALMEQDNHELKAQSETRKHKQVLCQNITVHLVAVRRPCPRNGLLIEANTNQDLTSKRKPRKSTAPMDPPRAPWAGTPENSFSPRLQPFCRIKCASCLRCHTVFAVSAVLSFLAAVLQTPE